MLTHYTSKPEAIVGILTHGFAWVPNRRKLTSLLVPQRDYSKREPQQFGMISFTEIPPLDGASHRQRYGQFGVVVGKAWAIRNRAQRVIYVSEDGALTESLQALFDIGYNDLVARIDHPDDGVWQMSFENKFVASSVAGALLWAHLLSLWEYLEPEQSSAEREWRIVNDRPDYSLFGPTPEIIAAVSPPKNWAKFTRVLTITPADVEALVCPASQSGRLISAIPPAFRHASLIETEG